MQEIEYRSDTGYQHVGVSICAAKKEMSSDEYELLKDETERHDACGKYRRARRNRKRYRKPRFNNRKGAVSKDGFSLGISNRRDRQIDIFTRYKAVMPVTRAFFEMGQFDTQVLQAVEAGQPVPTALDYQHGPQYGFNTLRAAVFARDNHTCQICGKGKSDGAILRVHHLGYLKGDHTDRMSNLLTVCTSATRPGIIRRAESCMA